MLTRLYYVSCDGCGRPCGDGGSLRVRGSDARALARRRGWLRIPRRTAFEGGSPGADYCPECAKRKEG